MLNNLNTNLVKKNDFLLLAVSGGIDSMVMLHCLNDLRDTFKLKIAVATFDHQKRKESFLDCQLVEQTCKKLSINCYVGLLNKNSNENFHDFARTKRYEFFVETANKIGANKIVLAHNANDNAETILMRLTRGSSFEGYRGILAKTKYQNVKIIRPLLTVSREEILAYQKENNILYNEDHSNQEDHYTRNRFRHHVLPLLEQENPQYLNKFKQFSEYLTNAYDFIEKHSSRFIKESVNKSIKSYEVEVDKFNELDEIIKIDVIKKIINLKTDNSIELNYINIQDIVKLFSNKKPNLELPFNDLLYIYKSYNSIYFTDSKNELDEYKYIIDKPQDIILPNGDLVIITNKPNKYYDNMFELCYNNIDFIFPITIRNRRNGDKIKTTSGTKKLKDLFINKKTPLEQRNQLPIFLNKEQEILWIPKVFKEKKPGELKLYLIYQEG
ncbi:MAG: tRNA lysidine(34) synthetase TilS [Tenericutes bacterium]|nr:tRNA lysidine(34) synthetase TilS [Mycoplasmatota bacterium]